MADGTIRFLPMVLNEQRATIVEKYKERWGMRKKYTAITGLEVQHDSISLVSMVREGAWLLQETPNGRFYANHYALTSQSSSVTPHMGTQNIFLVGLMAVGKSTVGRRLAGVLERPFFDSDEEIERRAGAAISWIFDVEGESGFRDREEQVIDDLSQREGIVLATGGGAVLREANRQRLAERGLVVHLHSSLDRLMARTENDRSRPLLQSGDPRKVLEELYVQREPLYAEIADLKILTAQQGINGLVSHLAKKIHAQISSG